MSELDAIPKELLQPDPVLPLPTRAQVLGAVQAGKTAELIEWLQKRVESIALRLADPLNYGFEPQAYLDARKLIEENDELLLMGANREGKTNFAGKFSVELQVKKPGALCAFFHSSERSSELQQQPLILSMFPPAWRHQALKAKRAAGKGGSYLSFTPGTGFTGAQYILPNGSTGLFFNYKQDVTVMEGYEFDLVWFDELVPLAFQEALRFRLSRNKRLIVLDTFTPVRGVTPVVMSFLAGAKIVETRSAAPLLPADRVLVKDCPPGHMPYIMRGGRERSAVLFFHNGMNPFGAGQAVRQKLVGAPEGVVKMRAFGWPDRQINGVFAKFSMNVHVITRARFEELATGPGTYYVVTDPRPGKNWFIKRYFVTPEGWAIVCWEWPDKKRHEEWALPPKDAAEGTQKFCWRPGPAQFIEAGRGIVAYKKLVLESEGWKWDDAAGRWDGTNALKIERRLIDPRMGGVEIPSEEEGTSLIAMMEEEQKDSQGRVIGPSMTWEAAPGGSVADRIEMIASLMDYDERAPVSVLNCPKWYAVEDCEQSIKSYQEYTGAGGEKDALKDPMDCDGYFVKDDCGYVAPQAMKIRRGGYY